MTAPLPPQVQWQPNSGVMRPTTSLSSSYLNRDEDYVFKPEQLSHPSRVVHAKEDTLYEGSLSNTNTLLLRQRIATRPGYSTGKPFVLYTNHLELDTVNSKPIYRYGVKFPGFEILDEGLKPENTGGAVSKSPASSTQHASSNRLKLSTGTAPTSRPTQSARVSSTTSAVPNDQVAPSGGSTSGPTSGTSDSPDSSQRQSKAGLIRKRRRMFEILLRHAIFQNAGAAVATDYAGMVLTATELDLTNDVNICYHTENNAPGALQSSNTIKATIVRQTALDANDLLKYLKISIRESNSRGGQKTNQDPTILVGSDKLKYYPLLGESMQINHCLIALKGYYTSVRTSTARLLINANVCTSAFYQEGRLDVAMKQLKRAKIPPSIFLNKLRLTIDYQGVTKYKIFYGFRINPKTQEPFDALTATLTPRSDGIFNGTEEVCVAEYFQRKYHLTVNEPKLPLVNLGVIKKIIAGEQAGRRHGSNDPQPDNITSSGVMKEESSYQLVPAQFCYIVLGQSYGKKLVKAETTSMKDFAARPPAENARRLVDAAKTVLGLTPQNPCLCGFGLRVKPELVKVYGRMLDQPTIRYLPGDQKKNIKKDLPIKFKLRSWNMNGQEFLEEGSARPWACLELGNSSGLQDSHIKDFHRQLKGCGLSLAAPVRRFRLNIPPSNSGNAALNKAIDGVLQSAKSAKIGILLVLLQDDSPYVYSRIKYISEIDIGIHTVCTIKEKFMDKWVDKRDATFASNLALKFNLKLGGANHRIAHFKAPWLDGTMVIGIDVSHPSHAVIEGAKSIAGVVANAVDGNFSQWPCSLRTQDGEIVTELQEMVEERLDIWYEKNKETWPKRILIYRDGVSDSQYDEVLQKEMVGIKAACAKKTNVEVPVTLVIVAKRHHIRFYPTNAAQLNKYVNPKRVGNPLPGTVVDRGVTMETGWDFYLQAHDCLQGTAKPAHYVVLENGIGNATLNAEGLERITHEFCYLFARALKPVSICAPAYYPHVACERGKVYLHQYYQYPPQPEAGKKPAWNPSHAPWTRTKYVDVIEDNRVLAEKDKLVDTMFYI